MKTCSNDTYRVFFALAFSMGSLAQAGSVDNRNNNSAAFIRTLSRNAATEGPDAAIYNPAGTVRFEDGLQLELDNQLITKYNAQEVQKKPASKFESTVLAPLYPTAFAVYKHGDWSGFAAFSFPGGGGALDYNKGSVTAYLLESSVKTKYGHDVDVFLQSIYYGVTVGGAYAIKDWVSLSLASRTLYTRTDVTIDAGLSLPPQNTSKLLDHMEEARGTTGIVSADFFPGHGVTVGLRFEGPTVLDWEVQKSTLNLESAIPDATTRDKFTTSLRQVLRAPGSTFRRDLPGDIGLGVGYAFAPTWRSDFSFNYYLNQWADWGGAEDNIDNGWEASLALEHQWPIPLLTSVGAEYIVSGAGPSTYSVENPMLDSYALAIGGRYKFGQHVFVNAAFTQNGCFDDKMTAPIVGEVNLVRNLQVTAVSLEYRFH